MAYEYMVNIIEDAIKDIKTIEIRGRVEKVVGTIIHAVVPGVKIGELCLLRNPWENWLDLQSGWLF